MTAAPGGWHIFGPRLRFRAFIAPFHPVDENPTLAIQRDLERVRHIAEKGAADIRPAFAAMMGRVQPEPAKDPAE